MTTTAQLAKLLGPALLTVSESSAPLSVPVTVIDARTHWGRVDVLVTPVGGTGEAWVSAERLKPQTPTPGS